MVDKSEIGLMRRVGGSHNIRLDGVGDILTRARGTSVMDIGCNRGMVAYEFAQNGAKIVHGCDNYELGIQTAREVFTDMREVKSQFEVVDLTKGPLSLDVFGGQKYDIMVLLATYHKLKRIMSQEDMDALLIRLGELTGDFFVWRATSFNASENDQEMLNLDRVLSGFKRTHTSYLSKQLGVAAIWERK